MDKNFKLYFKCILQGENYSFINSLDNNLKNSNLFLTSKSLYYLTFFFRFSSLFYSTQLVDIFSYEIPRSNKRGSQPGTDKLFFSKKSLTSVIIYNFHILSTQNRFLVFTTGTSFINQGQSLLQHNTTLPSISELFFSANWLEREVSELHQVNFNGKKDLRNLMLQYGDSTAPFQKSFPSIGIKELFYNPVKDTLTQNPISVQI
jgi:NADH:ubiquinone oxidoreductase subunit C